jgi:hypothetical protein
VTVTERERAAVRDHKCPRCHSQAGFKCIRAAMRVINLTHPHQERINLVPAQQEA